MALSDREFERFVVDSFDSEEGVMIVLALRNDAQPADAAQVLARLERTFGLEVTEERRVAEKRIDLRLRDLSARGLIVADEAGRYRYRGIESGIESFVERLATEFVSGRNELNRIIYSPAARARRLAEAFRL